MPRFSLRKIQWGSGEEGTAGAPGSRLLPCTPRPYPEAHGGGAGMIYTAEGTAYSSSWVLL